MSEINIGILVNTHGLRGEVKVKPTTDFVDIRFAKGKHLHVQFQGKLVDVCVESVKWAKQLLIVKFQDYDDINQVEAWKGSKLSISEDQLHELAEDEAYFFELQGCQVYDQDDTYLGDVSEVLETNANAVLRVNKDEQEFLVPYVKAFIREFNRDEKRIVINMMDGLL